MPEESNRPAGVVAIHATAELRLQGGHRWVYESEIASVDGTARAGDVVEVVTQTGRGLGQGLYSPHSKIRVRLLTGADEPVTDGMWSSRLEAAITRRVSTITDTTAYRVVHADGDFVPGLIVDRYGDTLVMQTLTVGMERRKEFLADLLLPLTGATAVYLRNDVTARALEGLAPERRFLRGNGPTLIEIQEGPARFRVDIERGQKTGWFCDQRENRLAVAAMSQGKDVLDAFCHTGGFGIHTALAGARSVAGLDASRDATEQARQHARLNQVEASCDLRQADAFDAFRKLGRSRKRFDVVILDPPAFAKQRGVKQTALEGYQHLHRLAIPLIRLGGTLVTCSCSHHVSDKELEMTVMDSARRSRRAICVTERRGPAADHPIIETMPETRYLSCLVFKV